ncbi:putative holin-like toxin [Marinicrinis lubricantis]|uniref:Holin-like toxin n=1 Tax=Marinicrinis lubricantis TaxID=2086470 RepID=A0ABW1ISI0_9BACL
MFVIHSLWYNMDAIESALKGGRLTSMQEVMPVEVKDTLMIMISFATLIVMILSFHKKK